MALLPSIKISEKQTSVMFVFFVFAFFILISELWAKFNFYFYMFSSILFALLLIISIKELKLNSKVLFSIGAISYEAYLLEGVLRYVRFHDNLAVNVILFISITFLSAILLRLLIRNITNKIS